MQALSIWPSASETLLSFATPNLDFEAYSCHNWDRRRKRLRFCRGTLLLSSNVRGFRCKYVNSELKWKSFQVSPTSKVYFLIKSKKGSLGASGAWSRALEEQVTRNDVTRGSLEIFSGLANSDSPQFSSGQPEMKDRILSGGVYNGADDMYDYREDRGDDDGGEKDGNDGDAKVDSDNNARIDVRSLAWRLQTATTADDVEMVLKDKGQIPLQVYSSVLKGFGKDKKLDSAMALYDWLKRKSKETDCHLQPNLYIYNSLLGAMKQAENFNDVTKVMNDMVAEGVLPNVVTYNTLMGIRIEQGLEAEALQLFKEMPQKGVSPSPATYSIVLLAYRRLEDGFGAISFYTEIFDKFQKGDIGKDSDENWKYEFDKLENFTARICYQVMRRWLVKSENLSSEVLRLLKEMDKAGLQPARGENERLVWACTREEHCIVAKELYTRIREMNSEISLSVCNHAIWLLGKAKKWWAALEIYEDLLDKGPRPNNMSYELIVSHFNVLLTAARRKGIWRWGMRLLNKMEEKGLKPGTREWNAVLVACSKAAETSAAIEIFKRMVEQGEKPTIISYGALLSALEKGKLYDEALRVWKHMTKMGVEPNLYAYTIMASIHAGQGKFNIVDSIIREMVSVGVEPTVVTFNAIISCCARNNLGSATAYEWFQRMEQQKVSPNEVTYEMMIEALTNDGKPRLAYEFYSRAHKEALALSTKAYDSIIQSSLTYGATLDASSLGPRPAEKKKNMQIPKNLSKPFDRKELHTSQTE